MTCYDKSNPVSTLIELNNLKKSCVQEKLKIFDNPVYFNKKPIKRSVDLKQLELTLEENLVFTTCTNDKIYKTLKGAGIFSKLWMLFSCQIYLDSENVIYKRLLNKFFLERAESLNYKKLYQELGLQHLNHRHWMSRTFIFQGFLKQSS